MRTSFFYKLDAGNYTLQYTFSTSDCWYCDDSENLRMGDYYIGAMLCEGGGCPSKDPWEKTLEDLPRIGKYVIA